jgi:hypothetical protein
VDPLAIAVALALAQAPEKPAELDLDAPVKAQLVLLDSEFLGDQVLAAMALPYKWGVTQKACKAKELQPARGWKAVREPSGRTEWVLGPATKVFWSGIYGTCLIQSPVAPAKLKPAQREALECECNGWLPAQ